MVNTSQQLTPNNKRLFDDLNDDTEMGDDHEMPPPDKRTRQEVPDTASAELAWPGSNDISFDDFLRLIDESDTRAILGMSPSDETNALADEYALAQGSLGSIGDEALEADDLLTQPWLDQFGNYQQEQDHSQRLDETPLSDFFRQATSSPVAADWADDWLETGEPSQAELLPEQTITFSEGIVDSEYDLMDVDDAYRLPDLPGSPLSDYKPTVTETLEPSEAKRGQRLLVVDPEPVQPNGTDMFGHLLIGGTSQNDSKGSRPKTKQGHNEGTKHIPGFPSQEQPLPSGLTLEQISWSYPNHLNGKHLQRFIEAGWGGSKIWKSMQEAAKQTNSKGQGWSKINKRLSFQRKRMELERAASTGIRLSGETEWDDLTLKESGTGSPESSQSAVEGSLAGMSDALRAELQEHSDTISQILFFRDEDWLVISDKEQSFRVSVVWKAKAYEHEAQFVQETRVETGNIPVNQTTQTDMLSRLRELLGRALLALNPPRDDMYPEELEASQKQHTTLILENELFILKSWTQAWKLQLERATNGLDLLAVGERSPTSVEYECQGKQLYGGESSSPEQAADPSFDEQRSTPQTLPLQFETQAAAGSRRKSPQRLRRDRLRMFPNAPSTNVILTEQDLQDRDNILENFPEHLALHHVMEQFLRPLGFKTGEYPTHAMIAKLRYHHNAKHGSDLKHPDRDDGLRTWLASQQDGARRARRGRQRRAQKIAKSHANSVQEDVDHDMEHDQGQFDAGHVRPEEVHQEKDYWAGYTREFHTTVTSQPNAQEERLSPSRQASNEQATQVFGNDPSSSDGFAAVLDPRLFG